MSDCRRCGNCCSNFLPLSKKEIRDLKEIIKMKKLKPTRAIFGVNIESACPFLNGNICNIYDYRPEICRNYTCKKFQNADYNDANKLFSEKRELIDLRKEFFNKE